MSSESQEPAITPELKKQLQEFYEADLKKKQEPTPSDLPFRTVQHNIYLMDNMIHIDFSLAVQRVRFNKKEAMAMSNRIRKLAKKMKW